MNLLKLTILHTIALAFVVATASTFATPASNCTSNTSNCNDNPYYSQNNQAVGTVGNTTAASNSSNVSLQGQTTSNAISGTNTSTVSGGQTTIDSSDHSTKDNSQHVVFIPPVVPGTPASSVGVGNVIQNTLACGPLQRVIQTPVTGTYFGFFVKEAIQQGVTYDLAPAVDESGKQIFYRFVPLPNGDIIVMGTQPVIFVSTVAIAGGRNIALGGGGSSGSWGQAGGGSTASMSQLVTNIQLRDCEVGRLSRVTATSKEYHSMTDNGPDMFN